jgi:hypothetical protein
LYCCVVTGCRLSFHSFSSNLGSQKKKVLLQTILGVQTIFRGAVHSLPSVLSRRMLLFFRPPVTPDQWKFSFVRRNIGP